MSTACPTCGTAAQLAEIVVVRVPVRTESEANRRDRWGRVERTKKQRRAVFAAMLGMHDPTVDAIRAVLASGPLVVTLTRVAPRLLDKHDNLPVSLKAPVDAAAEWLGLPNDRDSRVTWAYAQRRGGKGEYAVEIAFARRGGA